MKYVLVLATLLLGLTFTTNASAHHPWVYLGGAANMYHCDQMASSAGYRYYRFGGYIGYVYYWNACFGAELTSTGSSDWKHHTDLAVLEVKILYWEFREHQGYQSLLPALDRLDGAIESLDAAAEDGLSKPACYGLYRKVERAFEALAAAYYPVHHEYQHEGVGKSWRKLAATLESLRKAFAH